VDPLTTPQVVPEPQTWMLMAMGLALLFWTGRRRGKLSLASRSNPRGIGGYGG
jgi:hypothetical protein